MSGVSGLSSGEVAVGGAAGSGWWLVAPGAGAPGRVVAGPFPDRAEARWAAGAHAGGARPVHGTRRADGGFSERPSPQDWAWLAHLGAQLDRLSDDWDAVLSDEDPLTTFVVEVAAALAEAGLPLHDAVGRDGALGGVCLTPAPALHGIVVSWRQHDRMCVDRVHGAGPDAAVQQVMNRAVADVLALRGLRVEALGGGHVVRADA